MVKKIPPLPEFVSGFNYIAGDAPSVLVLGSIPSIKSASAYQYYAHPRNAFWPIILRLTGHSSATDISYEQRIRLVGEIGIVLWDVIYKCARVNSLDSSIVPESVEVNDFSRLFCQCKELSAVCFNGNSAFQLYHRYVSADIKCFFPSVQHILPSTSPTNARLSFTEKYSRWETALVPYLQRYRC